MSENAKIYHFPSEEALGDIESLAVSAPHGGVSEGATDEQADRPAPEEQAAHSALEERMPAGLPADSTHAYLWQHAAAAAAVVRTILHGDERGDGPLEGMNGAQIAAAVFIALGKDVGARVGRVLDEEVMQVVARAVMESEAVAHSTGMHALEWVRQRVESGAYLNAGGPAYAHALLEAVGGPAWAERTMRAARPESEPSGFYLLKGVAPDQIAPFMSHEHPQTIALILSQLEVKQSGAILALFPERLQADVAYRMATMEDIPPNVLRHIEESLESSLRDIMGSNVGVGGPKVVADMLNHSGRSVEKNVLDQMDAQDPHIAEAVRNLMFVFNDMVKLTDRELQIVLREIDFPDLVVALKAASQELLNRVLNNCSERVRESLIEEIEFIGPMRLSDVEAVQLRIVKLVRQLEEKGEITIVRGDGNDAFV
ncbi:MAG: flagellar motor switch protein FliG [Candidatus Latescibacterota bacterium]